MFADALDMVAMISLWTLRFLALVALVAGASVLIGDLWLRR